MFVLTSGKVTWYLFDAQYEFKEFHFILVKSLQCHECDGEDCRNEVNCSAPANRGCQKLVITTGEVNKLT